MKQIHKQTSFILPQVVLFLDDITRIVAALREVSPEVQIRTEDYSLESIEEFSRLDDESLTSLAIFTRDPYIHVAIEPASVRVYAGTDNVLAAGAADRVKGILESGVIVTDSLLESSAIVGAMIGAAFSVLAIGMVIHDLALTLGAGLMAIIFVCWDRLNVRRRRERTSRVWLRKFSSTETFWKRNSERVYAVMLALAMALLIILVVHTWK